MTTFARNLVGGAAAAVVLATVILVPSLASISTWKWAVAAAGLYMWLLSKRIKARRS
jgi:hypothetical protein